MCGDFLLLEEQFPIVYDYDEFYTDDYRSSINMNNDGTMLLISDIVDNMAMLNTNFEI